METVTDIISLGSKTTHDGDCSHEIKRNLFLGRKAMTNVDNILKSRDIERSETFITSFKLRCQLSQKLPTYSINTLQKRFSQSLLWKLNLGSPLLEGFT